MLATKVENMNPPPGLQTWAKTSVGVFANLPGESKGAGLAQARNRGGEGLFFCGGTASVISYDLLGNTVEKSDGVESTTFAYDYENRLSEVTTPEHDVYYAYDADGNRVQKIVDGSETNYLVDRNRRYAQVLRCTPPDTVRFIQDDNAPPPSGGTESLRSRTCQDASHLLRCAPALRVTSPPLRQDGEWPEGGGGKVVSNSAKPER